MERNHLISNALLASAAAVVVMGVSITSATATEPCGEFGECKALIEINATDGDVGFHFLVDGDDLISVRLHDPYGAKVFEDYAKGPLRDQKFTETFVESAEPLCSDEDADPDDEIVFLEEFLERWAAGTYVFTGSGDGGEKLEGETMLTYNIPAAPADVMYNGKKGVISWDAGDDLGECATAGELDDLVDDGFLPIHPEDVPVDAWEVVFEPDVEDGDPIGKLKFIIRVDGEIAKKEVTVPKDYLASLPDDTLVKIEVGAIGGEDNATFTEIFDVCINVDEGCEEED